jgi:hypothetical protein
MPCQVSAPPMPCCTSGEGSLGTCGGRSFEPPPLLLGAGDEATGSLAGWIVAGLRFFVVGARANEGSLTAAALFVSGLFVFRLSFVFRLFPCAPPALNANPGNCCEGSPVPVSENNPIRIANAQTTVAVIHAIRTATRPYNLASDVPFTMTSVWLRCRIFGAWVCSPPRGADSYPQTRSAP